MAAAGVAFFAFLALVPALGLVVQAHGLLAGPEAVSSEVGELGGFLPDEAMRALLGQLMGKAADAGAGFGWGIAGSLTLFFWSLLFAMRALMAALNHAYRETERRGFLALNGRAILLGLCGLGLAVGSTALLSGDPAALASDPGWSRIARIARWPFVAMIVALALAVFYRLGPCRTPPKWRWVIWGAVTGAFLWVLASYSFSIYVKQFARYEAAYGLAGAVLTLMLWLYLLAYAVLLGAALNAATERQTRLDTTVSAQRSSRE